MRPCSFSRTSQSSLPHRHIPAVSFRGRTKMCFSFLTFWDKTCWKNIPKRADATPKHHQWLWSRFFLQREEFDSSFTIVVHPASFLAELLLSLSSCISLLVGTFSFLHIFSCLTHLFLVPSPENQIKSLYPLFQGWTDSPGWRVKSLPCCGDNCKDMGKIRKGFVVLTKKAEYTSGRKD